MRLFTRNQVVGKVTHLTAGETMAVVKVQLDGGQAITSSITREEPSPDGDYANAASV